MHTKRQKISPYQNQVAAGDESVFVRRFTGFLLNSLFFLSILDMSMVFFAKQFDFPSFYSEYVHFKAPDSTYSTSVSDTGLPAYLIVW